MSCVASRSKQHGAPARRLGPQDGCLSEPRERHHLPGRVGKVLSEDLGPGIWRWRNVASTLERRQDRSGDQKKAILPGAAAPSRQRRSLPCASKILLVRNPIARQRGLAKVPYGVKPIVGT